MNTVHDSRKVKPQLFAVDLTDRGVGPAAHRVAYLTAYNGRKAEKRYENEPLTAFFGNHSGKCKKLVPADRKRSFILRRRCLIWHTDHDLPL